MALARLAAFERGHKIITQFAEYLIGGGVWFWSGYAAFAIFYSGFGWNWLPAKVVSDTIGFIANFFVQRYWAFNDPRLSKHNARMSARYILMMAVHIGLDYAIVGSLYHFGVTPYIGAFVAAGILTIWNYLWFRFFVFKPSD